MRLACDRRLTRALQEQAAKLDPGNATIYRFWLSNLFAAHRPADAMRVLRDYDSRFPGRLYRGECLFAFTGSTARWWDEVERLRAADDLNATLSAEFDLLRYEQRFDDMRTRLDQAGPGDFPQHSALGGRVGPSFKPVAALRGWERLLAGDPRGAAREGRRLAAFVENLPKVAWNEWWRSVLTAESALMLGENVRATEHARAAIRLTSRGATFVQFLHVRQMSARVLAWCGEHDAAIDLLEKLAREYPGIGPAAIVRDPLFRRPLSGHSRWKTLEQALDAQIAENQRLLR